MLCVDEFVNITILVLAMWFDDLFRSELPALFQEWGLEEPIFQKTGAQERAADYVVHSGQRVFAIELKAAPRTALVKEWGAQLSHRVRRTGAETVVVLAVPYMGAAVAQTARDAGISWMDLSGNADIRAQGLRIHVTGRPNRFVKKGRPSSAFAPKSSRVARALLLDPGRFWVQSDLARQIKLGRGFVSRIVRRLAADELIESGDDGRVRARSAEALLDAWHGEYDFGKHHILRWHHAARSGSELTNAVAEALQDGSHEHAFTGLAAAWAYDPFAMFRLVAVYLKDPTALDVIRALGAREEERGSNLWVVIPNDEGVFDGSRSLDRVRYVSPVQTWLDLAAMPERAQEAAERVRRFWLAETTRG